MNNTGNDGRKQNKALNVIIVVLLIAVLLATCVFGYTFAKYLSSRSFDENANSALWGTIALKEHSKVENEQEGKTSGKFTFGGDIIDCTSIKFDTLSYGTYIPKDPFILLSGTFEVSFTLFLKIVEIDLPETIEYEVAEKREQMSKNEQDGYREIIYKYTDILPDAGQTADGEKQIYLLENNRVYAKAEFDNQESSVFNIKFSVWIQQINVDRDDAEPDKNV